MGLRTFLRTALDLWGAAASPRARRDRPAVPYAWGLGQWWAPGGGSNLQPPGAALDYYRLAGDLARNAVVAVALKWYRDQFAQARLRVGTGAGCDFRADDDTPLARLLRTRPNPYASWRQTWGATADSFKVDGNAYWVKARDRHGLVRELYWIPNPWVRVEVDPLGAPARYIYTPGRTALQAPRSVGIPYDPADIVHFRDGLDPANPVMGLSTLKSVIRNIAGYNAGETYTAALLRNGGVSAWAITPKDSLGPIAPGTPDEAAILAAKRRVHQQATGENTGMPIAVDLPVDFTKIGESPESLKLDAILDRPEATILAALGLNALVCGLPSSAATRTYANLAEAHKQAWVNGVIPMQDALAEQARDALAPDFDLADDQELRWDRSAVEALNEQADARAQRAALLFSSTLYPRDQALAACGLDPVDDDHGHLYHGDQPDEPDEPDDQPDESYEDDDDWQSEEDDDDWQDDEEDLDDDGEDPDETEEVKARRKKEQPKKPPKKPSAGHTTGRGGADELRKHPHGAGGLFTEKTGKPGSTPRPDKPAQPEKPGKQKKQNAAAPTPRRGRAPADEAKPPPASPSQEQHAPSSGPQTHTAPPPATSSSTSTGGSSRRQKPSRKPGSSASNAQLTRGKLPVHRIIRTSNKSRVFFEGMEVRGVRDLSHLSESTLRAMIEKEFGGRDINKKKLHLHHIKQKYTGPLAEIPETRHDIHNKVQHPLGNKKGVGLTKEQRVEFNAFRVRYWKARAVEELERRGLKP